MQTTGRFVLLAALAVFAPLAQGASDAVSPIGKVVQLINDLEGKILKEGETAQKLYAEFTEWCDDRSKELGFEIKTGKSEVESLQAAIAETTATSASLSTKVDELAGSIAGDEKDLQAATEIRTKEAKDFAAEEKELMEVIDTLERAIRILERELAKGGASMLQTKNMGSLVEALNAMVEASAIGSADAQKLTAFVQSSAQEDDSDMSAPAAAAYEGKSGGIVDVLQDLLDKATAQLDDARKKETTAQHNFDMLKQSLTDEIKFATKDMDEAKKGMAAAAEKKSTAEGDLETTSTALKADVTSLADLHQQCMAKAEDFQAETKSRGEELKALATAEKVLKEMTGGAEAQSYSFLQRSAITSSAELANYEVVRFVRSLAHKQGSSSLSQLASRIASAIRMGSRHGADPFAKVKSLIADMLAKLESEAEADATKKAYCDKEMSETEEKKKDKADEVDKLSTKIDQMTAESAKLKEEVSVLQSELAKLTSSQAEMDKLRQEEHDVFVKNKAELEQGLEGVKKALTVLREYYAKDKAHDSADGAGSSIIGLLEVCESDFSKGLAGITTTEEAAANEYEDLSKKNEIEKSTKEQDVKYKVKESTQLDKSVAESSSDRTGVQAELDAVLEYDTKIKAECVAKPEAYSERKKRREAEIAGLKEALSILENEAALIQRSSRKSLRGVRRHVQ